MKIARRTGRVLVHIPTVRFVGITGALAMNNAGREADIDLLIITSHNSLWTTRVLVYVLLRLNKIAVRTPGDPNEKDKLCLNMWMDEGDLVVNRRNAYTAHEIAQIVPVINKANTYQKLLVKNSWIRDYWPRSVEITKYKKDLDKPSAGGSLQLLSRCCNIIVSLFIEPGMFKIQYLYMRGKITRERVSASRAFFHPRDMNSKVKRSLDD
jgi:hypothetical protein